MSKKAPNTIRKKEHFSFLKKFSTKQLAEQEALFALACVSKQKKESAIEKLKSEIKDESQKLKRLADVLSEGGVIEWEECEVVIDVKKMTKDYFYEGEKVGSEEADNNDLQTEISED